MCSSPASKWAGVFKHLLSQVSEVSMCVCPPLSIQHLDSLMYLDLTQQKAEKVERVYCTQSPLSIQTPFFSSLSA